MKLNKKQTSLVMAGLILAPVAIGSISVANTDTSAAFANGVSIERQRINQWNTAVSLVQTYRRLVAQGSPNASRVRADANRAISRVRNAQDRTTLSNAMLSQFRASRLRYR